jgi:predicted nucleic acid-binding Zn ribbon protein
VRSMRQPKRLGDALRAVRSEAAPATLLAATQELWAEVAGPQVAAESAPVSERDGLITVACHAAVWAQELDLLQGELVERMNGALKERGGPEAPLVAGLRFTADAARSEPR